MQHAIYMFGKLNFFLNYFVLFQLFRYFFFFIKRFPELRTLSLDFECLIREAEIDSVKNILLNLKKLRFLPRLLPKYKSTTCSTTSTTQSTQKYETLTKIYKNLS